MRVTRWVAGAAFLGVLAAGAAAWARGPANPAERIRARIADRVDDMLEAIDATPTQTQQIREARDRAVASVEAAFGDRREMGERGLQLLRADRIDQKELAALRAEHRARAEQVGDAVVAALTRAHDVLTPEQRRELADYARSHAPQPGGLQAGFMKRMVARRIDGALDAVKATAAQRELVGAAREHVMAAFEEEGAARQRGMERALAIFTADRIDGAKVAQLRAEHRAAAERIGDAVVQAMTDVHDAFTPAQRAQLAELIQAHHHARN